MQRFIYVSHASAKLGFDDLGQIETISRERNTQDGITGLLLWAEGAFIQLIEGPKRELDLTIDRISEDTRHSGMIHLTYREVENVICETWGMGCFPARSSSLPSAFLRASSVDTIIQRFNALQDSELISFFETFYENNVNKQGRR